MNEPEEIDVNDDDMNINEDNVNQEPIINATPVENRADYVQPNQSNGVLLLEESKERRDSTPDRESIGDQKEIKIPTDSELVTAYIESKKARQKADEDALLLKNRIKLLMLEEEKAKKKIEETAKKTNDIIIKKNKFVQQQKKREEV